MAGEFQDYPRKMEVEPELIVDEIEGLKVTIDLQREQKELAAKHDHLADVFQEAEEIGLFPDRSEE